MMRKIKQIGLFSSLTGFIACFVSDILIHNYGTHSVLFVTLFFAIMVIVFLVLNGWYDLNSDQQTTLIECPVPGMDAVWNGFCFKCKNRTLIASRKGFKNGGIEHCYTCGHERTTKGFDEKDISRMITSCQTHWKTYSRIPYNWHTLSEEERQEILRTCK